LGKGAYQYLNLIFLGRAKRMSKALLDMLVLGLNEPACPPLLQPLAPHLAKLGATLKRLLELNLSIHCPTYKRLLEDISVADLF
jgi:hypothetical protein